MSKTETLNRALLAFIDQCPDAYHTTQTVCNTLKEQGYTLLAEQEEWNLQKGGRYVVTRNGSSLIAFRVPQGEATGFMMTASHSDSPCFKLKPDCLLWENGYLKLNTEKYGGMIPESWMDRPLSVAGRVLLETKDGITPRLMQINRPLLVIPSLAIHMQSAEKTPLNPQVDLLPLLGQADQAGDFFDFLAEELQIPAEEILDTDLFLYPLTPGCIWGKSNEFLSAPRLDDLQCVFGTLQGFLAESHPQSLPVYCVFDNEEVGSSTKQGAKSTFLSDVLSRICRGLGMEQSRMMQTSMMLSCDNAHAIHPNHPEKADPKLRPRMNGGVVIKYNANQKYTTDGVSGALFRKICKAQHIPIQVYANRSDVPGGSTLGNLSCEKVSVNTIDIGLAQLSMHSAWETAGAEDTRYLADAVHAFYQTAITVSPDGSYVLDFV